MPAAVVLVTDFGVDDTYAGALVGACWRVDPRLKVVTATHGVPAGDVLAGAYHSKAAAQAFPAGSVLCAVVDPGVGTMRRAVAVDVGGVRAVAPDNGLLSYLWDEADPAQRRCVELPVPDDAAPTFHGRDVFAPAAARLARGAEIEELGPPGAGPLLLAGAFADRTPSAVRGRVAVIDHFGNAITTVRARDIGEATMLGARWEDSATTSVVRTYAEMNDDLAVLIGSSGHVEVASLADSRSRVRGPQRGTRIEVVLDIV